MSDFKAVRKYAAQYDLFNRLHSIAFDTAFVRAVANEWYNQRFPVIPNQRCGSWYCDPSTSSNAYAYFKSTDGHMSHWDFNLRRSNLALASYAEAQGGFILVDSTRRGKRMPDGLSKTVPIWCAVINLALSIRHNLGDDWDTNIYLPPRIVPATERSQIESKLRGWAESLEVCHLRVMPELTGEQSSLSLPHLRNPLRPFFIHPSTSSPPFIAQSPDFVPIVCLSTSRWVNEGGDEIPTVTKVGERRVAFDYVPGGGDDDELWARGLTAPLFHSHIEELTSADRDELATTVDHLVKSTTSKIDTPATASKLVGVPSSTSRLALDIGIPANVTPNWSLSPDKRIFIVEVDKAAKNLSHLVVGKDPVLFIPSAKSDVKSYAAALTELVDCVRKMELRGDTGLVLVAGVPSALRERYIKDGTETPLSRLSGASNLSPVEARRMILPLALVLLSAMPGLSNTSPSSQQDAQPLTKTAIADRLHSLVTLWPDGNPPRAALKRVNEFLMSEGRRK